MTDRRRVVELGAIPLSFVIGSIPTSNLFAKRRGVDLRDNHRDEVARIRFVRHACGQRHKNLARVVLGSEEPLVEPALCADAILQHHGEHGDRHQRDGPQDRDLRQRAPRPEARIENVVLVRGDPEAGRDAERVGAIGRARRGACRASRPSRARGRARCRRRRGSRPGRSRAPRSRLRPARARRSPSRR